MTPEQVEKLRKYKYDFTYYAPRHLKIRTKDGRLANFSLNSMQMKIDRTIEELKAQNKPVRIIILKYRQGGASTYTEGRIFHATSTNKLTNSLIVAHEDDASTNLFNMSKLFYDELADGLKPMKKASNAKEVVFENPTLDPNEKNRNPGLRSRIKIATANNLGAGRSATIHNLHASEVAFWRDGKTIMLGLMQAVPNTPNTMVVLESTANGVGGYFYDEWQRAKKGESDFVPLFFAWFEEPNYEMDVPEGFEPDETERMLMQRFPDITHRKLVWRRWCIKNNCGGDPELFKQEYPSDDMEAFLVSGRPRFDTQALTEYMSQVKPGMVGNLEPSFVQQPGGYLEVWKLPSRTKEYFIGADVARGLAHGDYSAAVVMDEDYDVAALWHGHIDPDLFAQELAKLGNYYHEAVIAIEENNHGLSVINKIKDNYYNLYKRVNVNKATDETREELGWFTSEQTKRLAVDHLASLIRERRIGVSSRLMIEEMFTYVRDDKGATNAQEGSYDDTVMAAAICAKVVEQMGGSVQSIVTPMGRSIEQITSDFVLTDEGFRHKSEVHDDDDSSWFKRAGW
ncbi:phage terminase large subunit family protein [Cohnella nanjingensis]|uniref:Terminase large subunit gp17-like C-terminal domain-containing protein n=1 Tax=Cohnella nanjingensis TaxID=1387779 RepID=A0A7X0RUB2_9BACL|nr:hypothetical protein [Cohnella nanjingensis]MBB6672616.1 hypothetical protein [Cohnella nanjingensis]